MTDTAQANAVAVTRKAASQAGALRRLHIPGQPLILPNAWDAATAKIVAASGWPAVATSSAAVAESLGYSDGGGTPPSEMFDAIARISSAVDLPVTADIERGYGLRPFELAERLVAAGAVGCNIEDSILKDDEQSGTVHQMVDPREQSEFIAAIRAAASDVGVPIVINARVDLFLTDAGQPVASQMSHVDEALERGRLYLEAGADCVFPILAAEPQVIHELVSGMGGPINIMCGPTRSPAELAALGVARISYGVSLFRATMGRFEQLVGEIRATR